MEQTLDSEFANWNITLFSARQIHIFSHGLVGFKKTVKLPEGQQWVLKSFGGGRSSNSPTGAFWFSQWILSGFTAFAAGIQFGSQPGTTRSFLASDFLATPHWSVTISGSTQWRVDLRMMRQLISENRKVDKHWSRASLLRMSNYVYIHTYMHAYIHTYMQ